MCSGAGFAAYLAKELTVKEISGRESVAAYMRLLIICWYRDCVDALAVPLKGVWCNEGTIGVVTGLHPAIPNHDKMSVIYLDWHSESFLCTWSCVTSSLR